MGGIVISPAPEPEHREHEEDRQRALNDPGPLAGPEVDPAGLALLHEHRRFALRARQILPRHAGAVREVLADFWAGTTWEIARLAGLGDGAARAALRRLLRLGWVDRYTLHGVPPVWTMSPEAALRAGVEEWPTEAWTADALVRHAGAVLVGLWARRRWPGSLWRAAGPRVEWRGRTYRVLCARRWPGETEKAVATLSQSPPDASWIVVASDRAQAQRIAADLARPARLRITWDEALVRRLASGWPFWRVAGGSLVEDAAPAD